jgi:hypothetical protein
MRPEAAKRARRITRAMFDMSALLDRRTDGFSRASA